MKIKLYPAAEWEIQRTDDNTYVPIAYDGKRYNSVIVAVSLDENNTILDQLLIQVDTISGKLKANQLKVRTNNDDQEA